jgi:hypothetical protein
MLNYLNINKDIISYNYERIRNRIYYNFTFFRESYFYPRISKSYLNNFGTLKIFEK